MRFIRQHAITALLAILISALTAVPALAQGLGPGLRQRVQVVEVAGLLQTVLEVIQDGLGDIDLVRFQRTGPAVVTHEALLLLLQWGWEGKAGARRCGAPPCQ